MVNFNREAFAAVFSKRNELILIKLREVIYVCVSHGSSS